MTETGIKLTACVLTFNNAETILACLKSLNFADEILVVDSLSTDDTITIACSLATRIIERPWPGFIAQRDFAIKAAQGEWMLFIDADEVISEELTEQIKKVMHENDPNINGYRVNRRSYFLGHAQRQWYPDTKISLFRPHQAKIIGKEPHAQIAVEGKHKHLDGDILHYPYKSITQHLEKINYMSSEAALAYETRGKKVNAIIILLRIMGEFFKKYFIKGGVWDGTSGLITALLSCVHVLAKYSKLWERENKKIR